jgi:hypothetical protein
MKGSRGISPVEIWTAIHAGALVLSAPAIAQNDEASPAVSAFRVRGDNSAPLNVDTGWLANENEQARVEADRPFRIRMEGPAFGSKSGLDLQYRRNGGEWLRLEAHDFPYPEREVSLDFEDIAEGQPARQWKFIQGSPDGFAVLSEKGAATLAATGGRSGLTAIHPLPWPASPDLALTTRFRLANAREGFTFVFGYRDEANHDTLRVHGDGRLSLARLAGGEEKSIWKSESPVIAEGWNELEFAAQEGRFTLELNGRELLAIPFSGTAGQPGLSVPPGGAAEFDEIEFEGVARAPRVSIVSTSAYFDGDPTADLLSGSSATFVAGSGVSLQETARLADEGNGHSEYEWPLVIRRYGDGPVRNEMGDLFEFRMVDLAGNPLDGSAIARVALDVRPGHLGGTFVETPGRIGPWQTANGDLYFIMEPSETDNKFMMMKSIDEGHTWVEIDGANRPRIGDLEAVDARFDGDTIHILHQVTRSVRYHTFRTSDHPTHPDSWDIRDEVAANADAIAQMATLERRSDDRLVAVFLADRLNLVIKGVDGGWSDPIELDPHQTFINTGPQAVLDSEGRTHLAYASDDGRIWYRTLEPDGTLTGPVSIALGAGTGRPVYGPVLPLVFDEEDNAVTIAYRLSDGTLWERTVYQRSGPKPAQQISDIPLVTNAVDSQQAGADLVMTPNGPAVLFIDEATRSIFTAHKTDGEWSEPKLVITGIDGSWVRGAIIRKKSGESVIGFVYDAGSKGGTGLNRYSEVAHTTE